MFGIVRPCTHRLGERFKTEWMAHLCGLCLALRGDHGQFARIVTNYDGLLVSVLTEAQSGPAPGARRVAGPCPLRGMRTAPVANGEGARLAAAVSLVLASAKVRDHVADRDGLLARAPIAAAARKVARGWDRAGARTGASLGFDTAVLVDAVDRQGGIETLAGPGTPVLVVTEPTETATAAAFAHTAILAGRPGNTAPLAEAGRYFGRLAHLLDAVEDQAADAASGAWNPLTATGTSLAEARRLCDDALRGIRLALREVEFADAGLAHRLLVHELRTSVDRAFGTASCGHTVTNSGGGYGAPPQGYGAPGGGAGPYGGVQAPHGRQPYGHNPYGPTTPVAPGGPGLPPPMGPGGPGGSGGHGGGGRPPQKPRRGLLAGCAVALGLFCTCQLCCTDHEGPWSRKKRDAWCDACSDCGDPGCGNCDGCCSCDGCCCDGCGCDC
ncbi:MULTISPECIES: DUF5685 family protein [unclassified Streptomyces]|uniref:DUF5685 family protein n=1 Tax=unclassified Streptomyces TaxID=2593676 RepID=UPI002252262E|nr:MULTISPECIES: DUF5685 family protein [unclassified Streptomyces]MCX4525074.1 DUF5685 family protein [Streptomyces sp. NBC_01551]MCX4544415.1 DUF5685 family protein [Streptomyces sp. NBC_01565]